MGTPPPTWEDIAWLREEWGGPFMLKGIVRVDDAKRAVDAGVSAISVSNHGGNNLDGTPAAIRCLPAIADAVGDQVEVLLDGGIRRGSDVVKAVALGARAVMIGRAYLWGLAANGQAGVENVLDILRGGIDSALMGLGQVVDPRPHAGRHPHSGRLHPGTGGAQGWSPIFDPSARPACLVQAGQAWLTGMRPATGWEKISNWCQTIGARQVNSAYHRRVAFPSELGNSTSRQLHSTSPVVVIPVGSTEQHGPHLPLDTDTRIATAVADAAATRLARVWMVVIAGRAGGRLRRQRRASRVSRHDLDRLRGAGVPVAGVRQVGHELGRPAGFRQRPRRQRRRPGRRGGPVAVRRARRGLVFVHGAGRRCPRGAHRNLCIATYFAIGRADRGIPPR